MADSHEMADLSTHYDGILSRPFLAEHWYQGFVAALTSFFILVLLLCTLVDTSLETAAFVIAPFSLLLLVAAITQQQRFELDTTLQRYRSCLWVLGLRFGEWQSLPAIDSVIIRHRPTKHLLPLEEDPNINVGKYPLVINLC